MKLPQTSQQERRIGAIELNLKALIEAVKVVVPVSEVERGKGKMVQSNNPYPGEKLIRIEQSEKLQRR